MRLLFVTPRFPFPPLRGDQMIPYYRLKFLSNKHRGTLITFYEDKDELNYLKSLSVYCERIIPVKLKVATQLKNLLSRGVLTGLPLQVVYYLSRDFEKMLTDLIRNNSFDIIHTYLLRMAEYTKNISGPKIIDLIDSMQLSIAKRLSAETSIMRPVFREELRRIQTYEKEIVNKYDFSIVVSRTDREYLNSKKVVDIPVGIDTNVFFRQSELPHNRTIIFSGNMGYHPNQTAIRWFIENCFHLIKQRVPDTRLLIVGANPGRKVRGYHNSKDIFVKGFVPSMINELDKAQIAICPTDSGYGMHIKILESMSCGLPVVATSTALGTIEATNRRDVIIADGPNAFSEACIELLKNHTYASEVGKSARKLVTEHYDWKIHVEKLDQLYVSLSSK